MDFSKLLSDDCPRALEPKYLTKEPNKSIELYAGPLEIFCKERKENGTGSIRFEWLPSPRIKFDFCNYKLPLEIGDALLKLPNCEEPVEVAITYRSIISVNREAEHKTSGHIVESIILGTGQDLSYILFHITNFCDFLGSCILFTSEKSCESRRSRITFEGEGWKITIDPLKSINNIISSLEAQTGYAITHVGKLERSNGAVFTSKEAQDILEALTYFLQFVRGLRSTLILPIGFNKNGE